MLVYPIFLLFWEALGEGGGFFKKARGMCQSRALVIFQSPESGCYAWCMDKKIGGGV